MAEKDAKVRLNLAASGFLSQLQGLQKASKEFESALGGIGAASEQTSRKVGAFGSAAKAGIGAAKTAFSELGASLKSAIGMVATLGGALSVAGSVRGAVELTKSYRDIAFGLQAGTEKAVTWQAVQTQIEGTADRWKQSNKSVASTYKEMAERMNDAGKASEATEQIAKYALAGIAPMEQLTRITTSLTEQFGIKPAGLGQGLAEVVALAHKAKMPIDELEPKMAQLGATAKSMGLQGAEGLQKMMGMLVLAAGTGKNTRQTFTEISDLFAKLSDPSFLKDIGTKTHMKLDDHGTPKKHVLEMVIAHAGGRREELAKLFSGADLQLVSSFGAIYKAAADKTNGDLSKKTHAGLDALEAAMKEAGKTSFDDSQVEKQAAANRAEAGASFTAAMNKLESAFTKKEMIEAIDKIAEKLPQLAEAIAKMLGWALEHPKEAVALGVAAKVIPAVVPAIAGSLGMSAIKGIAKRVGARGAVTAAETAAETGGAEVAGAGAAGAAGTAAGAGAAAVAGAAAAIGIPIAIGAGYLTYQSEQNKVGGRRKRDGTMQSVTDISQPNTPEQYDAMMAKERQREALSNGVTSIMNKFGGGGSSNGSGSSDSGGKKANDSVDAFVRSIKSGSSAGDKVATALERAAVAANQLADNMSKIGDPSGTNGMSPAPDNNSGSGP